eukprot:1196265-Prorocentrum_minimum.AAC.1
MSVYAPEGGRGGDGADLLRLLLPHELVADVGRIQDQKALRVQHLGAQGLKLKHACRRVQRH